MSGSFEYSCYVVVEDWSNPADKFTKLVLANKRSKSKDYLKYSNTEHLYPKDIFNKLSLHDAVIAVKKIKYTNVINDNNFFDFFVINEVTINGKHIFPNDTIGQKELIDTVVITIKERVN